MAPLTGSSRLYHFDELLLKGLARQVLPHVVDRAGLLPHAIRLVVIPEGPQDLDPHRAGANGRGRWWRRMEAPQMGVEDGPHVRRRAHWVLALALREPERRERRVLVEPILLEEGHHRLQARLRLPEPGLVARPTGGADEIAPLTARRADDALTLRVPRPGVVKIRVRLENPEHDPRGPPGLRIAPRVAAQVGTQTFADTGPLPSPGGLLSASLAQLDTIVASATDLAASSSGGNNVARTTASLANGVIVQGVQISATSVQAEAEAACAETAVTRGSSTIVGLTVDGVPIDVTGEPNQDVPVSDGTLTLNLQSSSSGDGAASIEVTALAYTPSEGISVLFGHVEADIAGCVSPPRDCHDFVTGFGFVGTGNDRSHFGFNAGFKPNSSTALINFNYIDHGQHMHVKAETIDTYTAVDTTRTITGMATVDGMRVGYVILVTDNGEPGTNDFFRIELSNGYVMEGLLTGGNILLHKPCL